MLHVLTTPAAPGLWNMAVDAELLERADRDGLCTLRWYAWSPPTLSLGHFQRLPDDCGKSEPAWATLPVVRRRSGGGAIVHDRELTYAVALPMSEPLARERLALYDAFHRSLIDTFAELGVGLHRYGDIVAAMHKKTVPEQSAKEAGTVEPFLCFERRTDGDVVAFDTNRETGESTGTVKIAGSAQYRRRGAVLQHGSILLAKSEAAPHLQGIADIFGRTVAPEELARRWQRHIERFFNKKAVPWDFPLPERSGT